MDNQSRDGLILRGYLGGDVNMGLDGLGNGAALILGIAILLLLSAFTLITCTSTFIRRAMGLFILVCATMLAAWHWLANDGISPVQTLSVIPTIFAVCCFLPKVPPSKR